MYIQRNLTHFNKLSRIFQPINMIPKNAIIKKQDVTSNSQKLMLDLGIIRQANPGNFHLLPLGLRAMEKLTKLVDSEMQRIDAQKIILPMLTSATLWETTKRIETGDSELFILKDRHNKKYVLSPTHEEAISDLLSSVSPLSYKQFPLRLYQITSKFRDEIKPRFGLMRAREFLMKDLYTFDIDSESALKTYNTICDAYVSFFDRIGIKYVKVLGTTGNIGGSVSHEFHYPAEIGEDRLFMCNNCKYTSNVELSGSENCPKCNSNNIILSSGIEVGHTFLLGEKYSKPLHAKYLSSDGKTHNLQMGSYGLGLSRILAASIEVLSLDNEIRWPFLLAPYKVIIIPPKGGSKEDAIASQYSERFYTQLNCLSSLSDNIIIDDRSNMTIGKRLFEARRIGYPFIIIIGNSVMKNPPLFELHDLNNNTQHCFSEDALKSYIQTKLINDVPITGNIRYLKKN